MDLLYFLASKSYTTSSRLLKIVCFSKKKMQLYQCIGLSAEAFLENSKTSFIWGDGGRVFRSLAIMDLYFTKRKGGQTEIGWLWMWGMG